MLRKVKKLRLIFFNFHLQLQNFTFDLLAHVDLNDGSDGGFQVVSLRFRRVEDLDGERSAGDAHQRRVVEVILKFAGVQSGAHHHDFQVAALSGWVEGQER